MIKALPADKALVVQLATLLVTVCTPQPVMVVAPALKFMVPVGETPPLSVAMKVTLLPTVEVPLPVMATAGLAWLTVCVNTGEVAGALLTSPA